jgi:hypothetical protein
VTATPVGDWIRKRYPPYDGTTHWLGSEDGDPGCCGGSHPACLTPTANGFLLLDKCIRDAGGTCCRAGSGSGS